VQQLMDLLVVAEMPVERAWKLSAGELKLGDTPPDPLSLALLFSGLAFSHTSWFL